MHNWTINQKFISNIKNAYLKQVNSGTEARKLSSFFIRYEFLIYEKQKAIGNPQ